MLKRFSLKKILVSASVLVTLLIICLVPSEDAVKFKQELKYNEELSVNDIYLLDGYQYVALTEMPLFTKSIEDQALEIIDVLIEGGPGENKIPSGFKALINGETHEVVDLILYLCSDQAAFITGSNYLIDGGRSCGAQN